MSAYHSLGCVPRKRHTVYRQPSGELYHEHLIGSMGFGGASSLLYRLHAPTRVLQTKLVERQTVKSSRATTPLGMRHFRLGQTPPADSAVLDRTLVLFNQDVSLYSVRPTARDSFFYRNGQADEIVFVAEGSGVLETELGELAFGPGDYLVIPRGILHHYRMEQRKPDRLAERLEERVLRLFVIEGPGQVRTPERFRDGEGHFLEHSPYCERDIRRPKELHPRDEKGEFKVVVKQSDVLTEVTVDRHPFDVAGWDGSYYPWALSIHDFEPIVGSLHQPPPVHQTFQSDGFVVFSFVPRPFDFHADAVPAPYNHSNTMCDEVIFYANNEFMSRKGIEFGSLTHHPSGLPHGPHPGKVEAAIGKKRTEELALMVDTFRPLHVAESALALEDSDYARSWLD